MKTAFTVADPAVRGRGVSNSLIRNYNSALRYVRYRKRAE